MSKMIERRSIITMATFMSLGFVGIFHAFWGTTLPVVRAYLNINIEQASILSVFNQVGLGVACLAGGLLCDVMNRNRVLFVGSLLLGSGLFFVGNMATYHSSIILLLFIGLGSGLVISSSNAQLVGLYPDRKGTILNIHHGLCMGLSLLSPLVMGYLISSQIGWEHGYDALGWLVMVLCVILILTRVPQEFPGLASSIVGDTARLFTKGDFVALLLVSAFGVGTQHAVMYLGVTYLVEAKNIALFQASMVLSAFFICVFVGRLACSWLALRLLGSRMVLCLLVLQFLCVLVAWLGSGWVSALAIALSGLGCSGIFPCLLALTGSLFFEVAGTSMGMLGAMNWVGAIIAAWSFGYLSERFNPNFGFIAVVCASFIALIVFLFRFRTFVREEIAHQ